MKISPQKLCMDLLYADTEEEVINLLKGAGYWDNSEVWRHFGDKEDNFSTIGNQSSTAEGALVEKLVNSADAVLMGECWAKGIEPNSSEAPRSIKHAVSLYFGDGSRPETQGDLSNWPNKKLRHVANRITLAATGKKTNPSITVVDAGEGQTPNSLPSTILSLDKKNKIDIHFVQGKFNMGGTGALRFCGENNLQLVISRRNPAITISNENDSSLDQWGFTVVRRENPTGNRKVSTYTYLAPNNCEALRFSAISLPLFPDANKAYYRGANWGTAVKLYEYKLQGKSHILRRDGLLRRLDVLLPAIALPVRLHECRNYEGGPGSFANSLTGLRTRLADNKNLENGFPTSSIISIDGQKMNVSIYAFKRNKADTYRKSEGIIFTLNGQTQGTRSKRFFSRKSVGLNRLEDSLLVMVDCSELEGRTREDLFMNSRDRMEEGPLLKTIEAELAAILKNHPGLRELRERRRNEDVSSKLEDSKPLEETLKSILSKYPVLASLFGSGGPLSDPFRSSKVKPKKKSFVGKKHPSLFRIRDKNYGEKLVRQTAINMRSRIVFETDVANKYFDRSQLPGKHTLTPRNGFNTNGSVKDYNLNLWNGVATLNLKLPENCRVGDRFEYEFMVDDETLIEPFVNHFDVAVGPYQEPSGGPPGPRREFPEVGINGDGASAGGLAIPNPIPVYESDWENYGFDKFSALRVIHDPNDDGSSAPHTYYINMDNIYLNTELKASKHDAEILRARWKVGLVLLGMALLYGGQNQGAPDDVHQNNDELDEGQTPFEKVIDATKSIAPVLLPMIDYLGGLNDEDLS